MKPDLSFVIPAHNAEAYLAEAISSTINQTHKRIETIVVDDRSTDGTNEIIKYFVKKDPRVRLVEIKGKDGGRGLARNVGNLAAAAPIIAVLDADDIADYKRAARALRAHRAGAEVFYGSAVVVDWASVRQGRTILGKQFSLVEAVQEGLNYIVHSTMSYVKAVSDQVTYETGKFAELGLDDWKFQLDVAKLGFHFQHTEEVLSAYRIHSSGISQTRDPEEVKRAKEEILGGMREKVA